jgi:hypothetical protein
MCPIFLMRRTRLSKKAWLYLAYASGLEFRSTQIIASESALKVDVMVTLEEAVVRSSNLEFAATIEIGMLFYCLLYVLKWTHAVQGFSPFFVFSLYRCSQIGRSSSAWKRWNAASTRPPTDVRIYMAIRTRSSRAIDG